MQNFDIIKIINPNKSFRTDKVIDMFDIHLDKYVEHFKGNINTDNDWNIGLIVGRSGTGKTTIAKQLFGIYDDFKFGNKAIIDEMPENVSIDEIIKIFSQVGFSSPPSWLKQYDVLSQGEKMRVNLAKAILSDKQTIVFDEFTSVVDRDVAKVISIVINKLFNKNSKKFIAISCHNDIVEWLQPDWIFNTDEMKFTQVKKNDCRWFAKYTEQNQIIGEFLGNIII